MTNLIPNILFDLAEKKHIAVNDYESAAKTVEKKTKIPVSLIYEYIRTVRNHKKVMSRLLDKIELANSSP